MIKKIKLAIFDMDGTVFESYLNWADIREELGIESNILKEIYKDDRVDHPRLEILENYESENTSKTRPVNGVSRFLHYLGEQKIKTALITNNNSKNTDYLLNKFNLEFDTVVTREMRLWKPDPDAFFHVMELYGCGPDDVVSIGDSHYDIDASKAAGISAIFIIKKASGSLPPVDDSGVVYFNDFNHLREILNF